MQPTQVAFLISISMFSFYGKGLSSLNHSKRAGCIIIYDRFWEKGLKVLLTKWNPAAAVGIHQSPTIEQVDFWSRNPCQEIEPKLNISGFMGKVCRHWITPRELGVSS